MRGVSLFFCVCLLIANLSAQSEGHEISVAGTRFLLNGEPFPYTGVSGTSQFGGPREATSPYDHILQIWQVWQLGAYITYHHDMFQTGYGSPAVPPSGIPDPEFSPYHRQVFEFIAMRQRYSD
jgi:hypothetical protein